MRCVLEKKSGLEMGGEMHSNMNHLCGGSAKGIAQASCRLTYCCYSWITKRGGRWGVEGGLRGIVSPKLTCKDQTC